MNAEEAIEIIRIAQHHTATGYVYAKMTEVMELIRRQADDLAAIEKAGKAAFGEMLVLPYFEDGWDVEISQPDGQCWLHGRGDTLADACRAATKGAG